MLITLGSELLVRDGEKLGTIDGFVVDAGTGRFLQVLVGSGVIHHDRRMVDVESLQRSDDGELWIDLDRATADALPTYVRVERAVDTRHEPVAEPFILPASGVGGPVMVEGIGGGPGYPDSGGLIDLAPIDPPPVEVKSNLEETDVVLGSGTDVVASDGHKLGNLAAVELGGDGRLERLVVRSGFLFTSDHSLPGSAAREFDDDRLLLGISRADAERAGNAAKP